MAKVDLTKARISVQGALRKLKRLSDRSAPNKKTSKNGRRVSPSKIRRIAKAAAVKRSIKKALKGNSDLDVKSPIRRRRRPSREETLDLVLTDS